MNRREFLKLTGMGAMTVFLSGCGLSALTGQERDASGMAAHEKGEISGGKNHIVIVQKMFLKLLKSKHKTFTIELLEQSMFCLL